MNREKSSDAISPFPERPRFLREAVLVPVEDGVLVDGIPQMLVLTGPATSRILPHLLPLMDGTRTLSELQDELEGIPAIHVAEAVSLLAKEGLVEEHLAGSLPERYNPDTLAFFRRFLSATRSNRSGPEAEMRLGAIEVLILVPVAQQRHGKLLQSMLNKTGLSSSILTQDYWRAPLVRATRTCNKSLVLALSFSGEDCEFFRKCDEWCSHQDIDWFRAVLDERGRYADLGPYFAAGQRPCYECFVSLHARLNAPPMHRPESISSEDAFWAGMFGMEVIHILTRIGPLATSKGLRRYDTGSWEFKDLPVASIPGCPRCRPLSAHPDGSHPQQQKFMHPALVFEDGLGFGSQSLADPASEQERPRPGLMLAQQTRFYSLCQQKVLARDLPTFRGAELDGVRDSQACTLDELATLLRLTAGFRDNVAPGESRRWAATAGNLGSVELYVAANNIAGLLSGLYFYQPREHSLALLRWRNDDTEIGEFIDRVSPSRPAPDALVIFTGAFHRVSRKYETFGYRLVNLDAGVAMSQLQLCASALQLHTCTARCWPDDLIESQLKLHTPERQVTGSIALSRERITPVRAPRVTQTLVHADPGNILFSRLPSEYRELAISDLLEMVYRESRTTEEEFLLKTYAIPTDVQDKDRHITGKVALPHLPGTQSIREILVNRRSVRTFTDQPVSFHHLKAMIDYAQEADALHWLGSRRSSESLCYRVLACNVSGLASGFYTYDPTTQAFTLDKPAPHPDERSKLYVQPPIAAAPAQIWIIGNLEIACNKHGSWGHRELLLRAGSAANRIWTAALSLGLAGTIIAGLVRNAAYGYLGLDGYRQSPIVAVPVGFSSCS